MKDLKLDIDFILNEILKANDPDIGGAICPPTGDKISPLDNVTKEDLYHPELSVMDIAKMMDDTLDDPSIPFSNSYFEDARTHLLIQAREIDRLKKLLEEKCLNKIK